MQQRWKNNIGLGVSTAKARKERGLVMTTTLISRSTTYKHACNDKFKY